MTILDTIVEHKRMEVMKRKGRRPLDQLVAKDLYNREALHAKDYFRKNSPNIIAEFKRKSPSKGVLNSEVSPLPVVESYKMAGAAVASILTDRNFFGGDLKDLENSKKGVGGIPLLRKDFMIDPYQVHEAKAYGADIILLIASVLSKKEISDFAGLATSLGLSVLLEVHDEEELEKWDPEIALVGVNNRNLRSFQTDIKRSFDLLPKLPHEALKISESGLQNPEEVKQLFNAGFHGFLMGERFMVSDDPGNSLDKFIRQLKK